MAREPEWIIPSWSLSQQNLYGAASPLCAISFPTWSAAPSGPIRRNWRKQRSVLPWPPRCAPELPLIAGGKSFGGRMTSQAQSKAPLQGVCGLAFLGFPLHPAGRPSQNRAEHLFEVQIPMLFLQGTRDTLAALDQLEPLCKKLGRRATLKLFADADHSFHVPARTGRKDAQVLGDVLDALAAWLDSVIASPRKSVAH